MTQLDLFTLALNLNDPWFVKEVNFTTSSNDSFPELHITIEYKKGSSFPCPESNCQEKSKVYDSQERTWRHLNFFQYKTYIHAKVPRIECSKHGIKTINVPWSSANSGFTLLFEALIIELAKHMTISEIARLTNENDTRLWRIIKKYVSTSRQEKDESKVKHLGIDETSIKGHKYLTIVADIDKKEVISHQP